MVGKSLRRSDFRREQRGHARGRTLGQRPEVLAALEGRDQAPAAMELRQFGQPLGHNPAARAADYVADEKNTHVLTPQIDDLALG